MMTFKLNQNILVKIFVTGLVLNLIRTTEACPMGCECIMGPHISVRCNGIGLSTIPDGLLDIEIHSLDLSDNEFKELPSSLNQIKSLTELNLNNNLIEEIPKRALEGFNNLIELKLQRNLISDLEKINPSQLFKPTEKLHSLYLDENPITTLSGFTDDSIIKCPSLKLLQLSKCNIGIITENNILSGLPALEKLVLASNPIISIPDLISDSLTTLDLSNTGLGRLQTIVLDNLPNLSIIDLGRNHRISLKNPQTKGYVRSESLHKIILSYCNMNKIELKGFPSIITAILRGNMIRELDEESFANNLELENIDLAYNAISVVDVNTFLNLKNLKKVNLSFNMIVRIERDTFKYNEVLTILNLSKNYINRFNKFYAQSLHHLNISSNEIMAIDPDALNGFPIINELDLSNNLLSVFPETIRSDTLQILDLKRCRITSLRNTTFHNFPELAKLVLSGNRLTAPPQIQFFNTNNYLREVSLGDNPWRCVCEDPEFFDLYSNLMNPYHRIVDRDLVKCVSPENYYGQTWESACWSTWYPISRGMSNTEKVWSFMMVGIIVFSGGVCFIMSIKRCIEGRKLARNEEERVRNLEEQRDITRQNRMRMEQEAQLNAPDARESCPPCYEDAILLPKLDGSFASLDELTTRRKYEKSKENENDNDDLPPLRRQCRCRSEEILSVRESLRSDPNRRRTSRLVRNSNLQHTVSPLNHQAEINNNINTVNSLTSPETTSNGSNQTSEVIPTNENPRSSESNSIHYHSTDILRLNHRNGTNIQDTPLPSPPTTPLVTNSTTSDYPTTETSPYSQRRRKNLVSFNLNSRPSRSNTDSIKIYEDPNNLVVEPDSRNNNNGKRYRDNHTNMNAEPLVHYQRHKESDF